MSQKQDSSWSWLFWQSGRKRYLVFYCTMCDYVRWWDWRREAMAGLISVMCCCRFVFWYNQQLKVLSGVNTAQSPLKDIPTKISPSDRVFCTTPQLPELSDWPLTNPFSTTPLHSWDTCFCKSSFIYLSCKSSFILDFSLQRGVEAIANQLLLLEGH